MNFSRGDENKIETERLDSDTPPPLQAHRHDEEPLTKSWKPGKASVRISLGLVGAAALWGAQLYHSTMMNAIDELRKENREISESNIRRDERLQKVEIDASYLRQSMDRFESLMRDMNAKLDLALRDRRQP